MRLLMLDAFQVMNAASEIKLNRNEIVTLLTVKLLKLSTVSLSFMRVPLTIKWQSLVAQQLRQR